MDLTTMDLNTMSNDELKDLNLKLSDRVSDKDREIAAKMSAFTTIGNNHRFEKIEDRLRIIEESMSIGGKKRKSKKVIKSKKVRKSKKARKSK